MPLGSGAGGWVRNTFFFVDSDLKGYFEAINAGRKPLAFALKGPEKNLLLADISYQMELGYCDIKMLSSEHRIDLLSMIEPIISQWEKIGLIKISDGCLYLTRAGEFWVSNLTQILIDIFQTLPPRGRGQG